MAHIQLTENLPGIRGLMAFRPETALPLNALAESLLRTDEGLTKGERELIATFVSSLNDCFFCQHIHGAVATYYSDENTVKQTKENYLLAPVSEKMKALLAITGSVQQSGKSVTAKQIQTAKDLGATDLEIHDTVLIAAAFCMFSRYVDGLGTFAPDDAEMYRQRAKKIAEETGYLYAMPQ
ncbi:MAG: carboxymuconolactone decarboxylase family protein [Verrucomicrobia bacterium]|nr:carboxymuconolactone decarboxylase family protein [Cytophagales bacterium]